MTFLLTAPERLALCAYDADTRIVYKTHEYVETIDSLIRPAVYIEDGEGDYPPHAAGVEVPNETYTINIVMQSLSGGPENDVEQRKLRSIVNNVCVYFFKHPRLQMSDKRNSGAVQLPALTGVQYVRLRRGVPTVMSWDGTEPFWGCTLTATLVGVTNALEILVKNS